MMPVVPETARGTRKLSRRCPRADALPRGTTQFAGTKRVSDGTRTRGRRDHNPELYQLSYAHQDGTEHSGDPRLDQSSQVTLLVSRTVPSAATNRSSARPGASAIRRAPSVPSSAKARRGSSWSTP